MEGSRLRILQLLQRNQSDTVEGLATAMDLAPATIRRHLDILQRDRLVSYKEVRKKTGRPEYSFFLTEEGQEALPKDYDRLLNMIVTELSQLSQEDTDSKDGQEILDLVFHRLSGRVAQPHEDKLHGKELGTRLEALIGHLEREDFLPEAEVRDGKLRIRLFNCPFRSVALQNKAVCSFDLNLISSLLDVDVEREQCIHDGDGGCMYTASIGESDETSLVNRLTG